MRSAKSDQGNDWDIKDFDYDVPEHSLSFGYSIGGVALFGFVLLALTGTIMALLYVPTVDGARESVLNYTSNPLGLWLRSFHRWTADAILFLVILHLSRIILTGSYMGRRKYNWFFGIGLLFITFIFFFTGTTLKWDQEGYEALLHMIEATALVPLGGLITSLLEGTIVVMRLFVTHTLILPAVLLLFLIPHMVLMKLNELSPHPNKNSTKKVKFSKHLKGVFGFSLAIYGFVAFLAAQFPVVLYPGPYSGVEMTKPPWAFLSLYALEDTFGMAALIISPIIVLVGLVILPYIDSKSGPNSKAHKIVVWSFLGIIVIMVGLIIYVALTPPVQHLDMMDMNMN